MTERTEVITILPLTDEERARLKTLENDIDENMSAGLKLGMAIAEIKVRQLFRETHETWEAYIKDRFGIARRTAFQYMASASVFRLVHDCAPTDVLPSNEYQVRPLLKLTEDKASDAWKQAVETAPDGKITGSHVARVVANILGEQIRQRAQTEQGKTRQSMAMPDHLKKLVWQLIEQVRDARLNKISKTVRNELRARLQGLLNLLDD